MGGCGRLRSNLGGLNTPNERHNMQEMSTETQNKQTTVKSSDDMAIIAGAGADSNRPKAC